MSLDWVTLKFAQVPGLVAIMTRLQSNVQSQDGAVYSEDFAKYPPGWLVLGFTLQSHQQPWVCSTG
jgi:hypothetical protein